MTPKLIIIVEEGLIQQILSDVPITYCILDFDIGGAEYSTQIPFGIVVKNALCTLDRTNLNPKETTRIYEFLKNEFKITENDKD